MIKLRIYFLTCALGFAFVSNTLFTHASAENPVQSSSFDQKKWDQLVKEAGWSEKQVKDNMGSFISPYRDSDLNSSSNKMMRRSYEFSMDIWSGKYSTSHQFPKVGSPTVNNLDSQWKKDELLKDMKDLHAMGYHVIRYAGDEASVLQIINDHIKRNESERKKTEAMYTLFIMILKGEFPYDKYEIYAQKAGLLEKKMNSKKITIQYKGELKDPVHTPDKKMVQCLFGSGTSRTSHMLMPGDQATVEANTVPMLPSGLQVTCNAFSPGMKLNVPTMKQDTTEIIIPDPFAHAGQSELNVEVH